MRGDHFAIYTPHLSSTTLVFILEYLNARYYNYIFQQFF